MTDYRTSERLSAYLDGELVGEEHAEIEQLIAVDSDAQLLLAELRQTKALVQSLPAQKLPPQFSAGVLARIAAQQSVAQPLSSKPSSAASSKVAKAERDTAASRKPLWIAAASLAAVLLVAVTIRWTMSGPTEPINPVVVDPEVPAVAPELVPEETPEALSARALAASVLGAIEAPGEVAVLRVKLPAGLNVSAPMDDWLAEQKVSVVDPSQVSPATMAVSGAYRKNAQAQIAGGTAAKSAGEAVYVELPADMIEQALASLHSQIGIAGDVQFETKLALDEQLVTSRLETGEGEGESSARPGASAADDSAAKAQRINPRILRLPEVAPSSTTDAPKQLPAAKVKTIRVLILVEDNFR